MKTLVIFILFLPFFGECYDFYREYCMPLAAAAYNDDPNPCLPNVQIHKKYTFKCNSFNDTCFAYTTLDPYGNNGYGIITIAYRGTTNYDQFYDEDIWNFNEMVSFVAGGKINKLFFDGFNEVWNKGGMKDDINILKNKFPSYIITVTGHSVGGAFASLTAGTIAATGIKPGYFVWLVTFGQPRIGDKDFANAFYKLGINAIRIIHNHDLVPHLPPLNETVYYHFLSEIWYQNGMSSSDSYVFCNDFDGEDEKCSDSLDPDLLDINDHKFYYGYEVSEYGITGCPDLTTTSSSFTNMDTVPSTDSEPTVTNFK